MVPETKLTLTALPEEGLSETPVTVARNVRMERCAEGEGGVARRVSESVALPVPPPPPPPAPVFGPLHAYMEKINEEESKQNRIRFIVGPGENVDAFGTQMLKNTSSIGPRASDADFEPWRSHGSSN